MREKESGGRETEIGGTNIQVCCVLVHVSLSRLGQKQLGRKETRDRAHGCVVGRETISVCLGFALQAQRASTPLTGARTERSDEKLASVRHAQGRAEHVCARTSVRLRASVCARSGACVSVCAACV